MNLLRNLLIDFDGTLISSAPGIFYSYEATFADLKKTAPDTESLRKTIGPGVETVFRTLFPNESEQYRVEAVNIFRRHYDSEGYKRTELFSGAVEFLRRAKNYYRLFLTTMKAHSGAVLIVRHLGLAEFFSGVYGFIPFGPLQTKIQLIGDVLAKEKLESSHTGIIGDTLHDVDAGRAHGLRTFAVTWGYGQKAELQDGGAEVICDTFEALERALEIN